MTVQSASGLSLLRSRAQISFNGSFCLCHIVYARISWGRGGALSSTKDANASVSDSSGVTSARACRAVVTALVKRVESSVTPFCAASSVSFRCASHAAYASFAASMAS